MPRVGPAAGTDQRRAGGEPHHARLGQPEQVLHLVHEVAHADSDVAERAVVIVVIAEHEVDGKGALVSECAQKDFHIRGLSDIAAEQQRVGPRRAQFGE